MNIFDIYCGFKIYKINGSYIAKNNEIKITADNEHELYQKVKLYNICK